SVAPLARPISSRMWAPLLSGRGFLAAAVARFLADLAPVLVRAVGPEVRGCDGGPVRPLGAALAPVPFRAASARLVAAVGPVAPSFGAVSRFSAFVMLSSFALVAHDDSS